MEMINFLHESPTSQFPKTPLDCEARFDLSTTQNLLVNVRDPVSRIFMKTNKISLLRNITLEDFIALSKWLQKSGKCNISYLLEQQVQS